VVDGGYKITGQWGFSSGCSHAQWAIVGGMVPPAAEGQPPAMKLFLVPRKDYDIIDTWQTYGLRGTGSNDLKIEAAFVPAYRSFQPAPGFLPELGLTHLPTLYRLPWLYMFTCSVSNLAIGAAQGALSAFIEVQKVRISAFTGQPTKDNPAVAVAIARLQAEIDTVQSQYHRHIERMLNAIDNNAAITMPEGLQMRTQLTGGLRRLASQVDELQLLLGGRGIRSESPLSRLWLDLMTARSHPGNDPAMIAPVFGNALLGA
jgi:3-hydroxy-9,10-secoandrosta-1,3,5(10)-triene-9,17-dione monooxygenase